MATGTRDAIPSEVELVKRLLVDDEDLRYRSALEVARLGDKAFDLATVWLNDPRPRLRDMACYVLGQIGPVDPDNPNWLKRDPRCVPPLIVTLVSDPDDRVRAGAASALGHHAALHALPALLITASDASPEVRFHVAVALGSYHWDDDDCGYAHLKDKVGRALLTLMDDDDEEVRDWATFGVHQIDYDTPDSRRRLWQALDDSDPDVRAEAADGLAKFGDKSLAPKLEELLREDDVICSLYFEAAEKLGDPSLIPAMQDALSRWSEQLDEGEAIPSQLTEAIEYLQSLAETDERT